MKNKIEKLLFWIIGFLVVFIVTIKIIDFIFINNNETQETETATKQEQETYKGFDNDIFNPDYLLAYEKPTSLNIIGENNKMLTLDFSGDKLKVTGNLDYDEAAKLLLEHIGMNYCKPSK